MAFIVARHLYPFDTEDIDDEEIINIMNNNYLSTYFLGFAREVLLILYYKLNSTTKLFQN